MQKNLPCITREHLERILKQEVFKNRPLPEISDEDWDVCVGRINEYVVPWLTKPLKPEKIQCTRREIERVKQAAKKLEKLEKDARSSLEKYRRSLSELRDMLVEVEKECDVYMRSNYSISKLRDTPVEDWQKRKPAWYRLLLPKTGSYLVHLTGDKTYPEGCPLPIPFEHLIEMYSVSPCFDQPILTQMLRRQLTPLDEQLSELIERINKVLEYKLLLCPYLIERSDEALADLSKRSDEEKRRRPRERDRGAAIWMLADVYRMLTRREPGLSFEPSGPFFRFVKAIFRHLPEAKVYDVNIEDETLAKAIKKSLSQQRKKQSQQRKKQSRLRKQAHTTSPKP
jgi:lysyl-tRNA synthetase class I